MINHCVFLTPVFYTETWHLISEEPPRGEPANYCPIKIHGNPTRFFPFSCLVYKNRTPLLFLDVTDSILKRGCYLYFKWYKFHTIFALITMYYSHGCESSQNSLFISSTICLIHYKVKFDFREVLHSYYNTIKSPLKYINHMKSNINL